jgi:hypothetical protein
MSGALSPWFQANCSDSVTHGNRSSALRRRESSADWGTSIGHPGHVRLRQFRARGLLRARGQQRTDSTHVLAAIRTLDRLESVGETLRAALNSLAVAAPDGRPARITPDWFNRYGMRVEAHRLPKGQEPRARYAAQIGADGFRLLDAIEADGTRRWLRELPAVQTLRQMWAH